MGTGHRGWTEAELLAMTREDRKRLFEDGMVVDLRSVPAELAEQALQKIRTGLQDG